MKADVLDKGFVRLKDHMGSDLTVVNAARVSFAKESDSLEEKDKRLIRYLAKHNHWTPFGHPQVQLHFKMPIFVRSQWMRSNVGIVYNEVSRRYVDDPPEFYEPTFWRMRPEGSIKQGSGERVLSDFCYEELREAHEKADSAYQELLKQDVAPEMARMVLPQSMYTEFWMTASLAAVARMYWLRVDEHAQWETQEYARAMGSLVEPLFPVSWEALVKGRTD